MPRKAREKCEYSIYHIMIRGNNKQDIFIDQEDRIQYLERLKRYKETFDMEVYAYCLMTNHVHLLVYDNGQDISEIMKRFNLSYVIYFNRKYDRCGHLFQDRFKSVMVDRDAYFVEVSKYIHLNPEEAHIVEEAGDYQWSSLKVYLGERDPYQIIDTTRILAYFSKDYDDSVKLYAEYMGDKKIEEEIAATIESGHKGVRTVQGKRQISQEINTEQIIEIVSNHFNIHQLNLLRKNSKNYRLERDIAIYILAVKRKISYSEIGHIFGVGASAIGMGIKRAVNSMISDEDMLKEVHILLKKVA